MKARNKEATQGEETPRTTDDPGVLGGKKSRLPFHFQVAYRTLTSSDIREYFLDPARWLSWLERGPHTPRLEV